MNPIRPATIILIFHLARPIIESFTVQRFRAHKSYKLLVISERSVKNVKGLRRDEMRRTDKSHPSGKAGWVEIRLECWMTGFKYYSTRELRYSRTEVNP